MSMKDNANHSRWSKVRSDFQQFLSWLRDSTLPTHSSIRLRFLLITGFVLVWLYYSLHSFVSHIMSNPFNIGEWLVNYEAGFVRRGLLGSFTLAISDLFSASPSFVAFVMQSSIAALVLAGIYFFLTRSDTPVLLFICMLGPMGFTYFLVDLAVVGRKEILLYGLSILWIFYLSRQHKKDLHSPREWIYLFVFSGLFTFSILSHEGFIFLFPILIWLTLVSEDRASISDRIPLILRTAPFLVALVTTIPVLLIASSRAVGPGMCDAITMRGVDKSVCVGGINLASQSGLDAFDLMADSSNLPGWILSYGPVFIVLWLVLMFHVGRQTRNVSLLGYSTSTRLNLTVLFLLASPIFIVSVDWGRYLSMFFSLVSLGLLFIYQQRELSRAVPSAAHTPKERLSRSGRTWAVTIIGSYYLFFGVSHIGGVYQPLIKSTFEQTLRLLDRILSLGV